MINCELHCHSLYSPDSAVTLEQIIQQCQQKDIKAIALTDHNQIVGGLALEKIAPAWLRVIIAEEISTRQGDVIALFIKEKIEPGQDIREVIARIRQQKGLVLLPHPFDRIRKGAVGGAVAEEIKDLVDFVEVFNSRCLVGTDNRRAADWVKARGLAGFVGSDAHTQSEYGNALNRMEEFKTKEEFKVNLREAIFISKRAVLRAHLKTEWVKRYK